MLGVLTGERIFWPKSQFLNRVSISVRQVIYPDFGLSEKLPFHSGVTLDNFKRQHFEATDRR